jgi:hypothetical protein
MKMAAFWDVALCSVVDIYRLLEELTASFTRVLIMEAVNSSESPVNIHQTTWCNIPEDSHLHTLRRENLKSNNFRELAIDQVYCFNTHTYDI